MIYVCSICAYPIDRWIDMIDMERKSKSPPRYAHRHACSIRFCFFCFIVIPVHELDNNSIRPSQPKPVKHFISFQPNTRFLFFLPVRSYTGNQLYLIGKSSSLPVSLSYSFLGGPGCWDDPSLARPLTMRSKVLAFPSSSSEASLPTVSLLRNPLFFRFLSGVVRAINVALMSMLSSDWKLPMLDGLASSSALWIISKDNLRYALTASLTPTQPPLLVRTDSKIPGPFFSTPVMYRQSAWRWLARVGAGKYELMSDSSIG